MQNKQQGQPLSPAVMVHFYRGLLDLATTWRGRIDGTTNWAVLSSGSITSFLLSNPEHSHIMALLGMFLAFAFLSIEARRYRFYNLWSSWIRIMETEYYEPLLRHNTIGPREQWQWLLDRDLENPYFKINWMGAVGSRLRHNYLAIFGFLLLVWCTKLLLHPEPATFGTALATMYERAALGPLRGEVVIGAVALFYSILLGLTIATPRGAVSGETLGRQQILRQLVNPQARRVGFKHYDEHTPIHREEPRSTRVMHAPEED